MKRALFQAVGMSLLALGMTSCLTMEQTMYLNPDNSGKIDFVSSVNLAGLGALGGGQGGAGAPDSGEMGKEMLAQFVKGAEGVETWGGLKHEVGKDGAVKISGTAYFQDVNKFTLGSEEGPGSTSISSKQKGGVWTIETVEAKEGAAGAGDAPKPSDAEVQQNITEMQAGWGQMKPIMEAMMGTMKVSMNVKLGGTITKTVNFKKTDDSSASMVMDGKKLMTAMDKMITDPKMAKKMAELGVNPMGGGAMPETPEFYGLMFGENAYPKIEATPGKPLFDYKAEVAEAKKNPTKAMKELLQD
jgi:hypothetical protein